MSFEALIGLARAGGADWLAEVQDPEKRRLLELQAAKASEDRKTIDAAWARFAASPDGKMALDEMFDATVRRAVMFVSVSGMPADQVNQFGAFREGQNALAWEIARHVAAGQGKRRPKPRER